MVWLETSTQKMDSLTFHCRMEVDYPDYQANFHTKCHAKTFPIEFPLGRSTPSSRTWRTWWSWRWLWSRRWRTRWRWRRRATCRPSEPASRSSQKQRDMDISIVVKLMLQTWHFTKQCISVTVTPLVILKSVAVIRLADWRTLLLSGTKWVNWLLCSIESTDLSANSQNPSRLTY